MVMAPHIVQPIDNDKTLDEYLADFEMRIIHKSLTQTIGSRHPYAYALHPINE